MGVGIEVPSQSGVSRAPFKRWCSGAFGLHDPRVLLHDRGETLPVVQHQDRRLVVRLPRRPWAEEAQVAAGPADRRRIELPLANRVDRRLCQHRQGPHDSQHCHLAAGIDRGLDVHEGPLVQRSPHRALIALQEELEGVEQAPVAERRRRQGGHRSIVCASLKIRSLPACKRAFRGLDVRLRLGSNAAPITALARSVNAASMLIAVVPPVPSVLTEVRTPALVRIDAA